MLKKLGNIISQSPILFFTTIFLLFASTIHWIYSLFMGIAFSKVNGFGYVEKLNWGLQPLFWPILAALVFFSWKLYRRAWEKLPERGVLYSADGKICKDTESTGGIIADLEQRRPLLAFLSIFVAVILTVVDAGCYWSEYLGGDDNRKNTIDNTLIWMGIETTCSDKDSFVAYRLGKYFGDVGKVENGIFVTIAYILQSALGAYAIFALLQILIQSFYFLQFENRRANVQQLHIRLNYCDRFREFGLTDVNEAINFSYVFIAFGMLLPTLSAHYHSEPEFGQVLLQFLLPFILLAPAAIPVLERTRRVRMARERMIDDPDPDAEESYFRQKLWPFVGNTFSWIGNLGFLISVGLYTNFFAKIVREII